VTSMPTHEQAASGLLGHTLQLRWSLPVLAGLAALPVLAALAGDTFYVGLATRILIFALAATSLNLILGFGGLVSFGHAAFVGVGAYTVAILMQAGVVSAWVAWPVAMLASAGMALLIGLVSLRTQGVYFIMITLAFAQMLYYLVISLKAYGGDDGLSLASRSSLGLGLDLGQDVHFYYVTLVLLVAVLVLMVRLLNARFGHVLQAIRENEVRMTALGFAVFRYKLVAFTVAGALAGLAGALLANQGSFVSPALMQWSQSGMLMIMVILGGVGHLYGGVLGAIVFLLLEEFLSHYTIHWQLGLGAVLLGVVLMAPNGLTSLVRRRTAA
jgi:branched-chain amino acid transport system permease protein